MSLEQTNESVHGHEIMRLIASAEGTGYPVEQLESDIAARFGPNPMFHACAGDNMTLGELLEFLKARGKVVETPSGLQTDLGEMCAHEEGD